MCFGEFGMDDVLPLMFMFLSLHVFFVRYVMWGQIMEDLNLGDLVGQPYGSHKHYSVSFHADAEVLSSSFALCQIKGNATILFLARCMF